MIALDTNIFIRYLTQDHPKQAKILNKLFDDAEKRKTPLFINLITVCEIVWVLESCYNQSKEMIIETIKIILKTPCLKIDNEEVVTKALSDYTHTNADFSDCLIAKYNQLQDCHYTYTFDKLASKVHGFKVLQ